MLGATGLSSRHIEAWPRSAVQPQATHSSSLSLLVLSSAIYLTKLGTRGLRESLSQDDSEVWADVRRLGNCGSVDRDGEDAKRI